MPRQVPIARLTVDRPSLYMGGRAVASAQWLEAKAEEIESEPNCFDFDKWVEHRYVASHNGRLVAASRLVINAAGALSAPTRKRIAKWLRSRAAYLRKHWAVAQTSRRGWFTQEFSL